MKANSFHLYSSKKVILINTTPWIIYTQFYIKLVIFFSRKSLSYVYKISILSTEFGHML